MSLPIYRYKLSDNIMELIIDFAKLHQYDDRKTYKEYWEQWCEEYSEEIKEETERLETLGYVGSVTDKMFKAGRYYFRKKYGIKKNEENMNENNDNNSNDESDGNKKKRKYISIDHIIIETMDKHIQENIDDETYKPANGFNDYYEENEEIITRETQRLLDLDINIDMEKKDIFMKIKKTYKNRYFIITRKNKINNDEK